MRQIKIYRPLLIFAAIFAFFVIARIVIAQSQTAPPAPVETSFKQFSELLGLGTQIVMAISAVTVVVWFIWRGRSNLQLEKNNKDLKEALELEEKQCAKIKLEIGELRGDIKELERTNENLRKANLRLQGITGE